MKRRDFVRNMGILGSLAWVGELNSLGGPNTSPVARFKLGAISDGFSQDFEDALKIMKSYRLSWVEIRNVWGRYNTEASPERIQQVKDLLAKYEFKCAVVDTALFKCTLPGTTPDHGQRDSYPYAEQMDLLKRALERAHAWGTDKLRVFAFWRTNDLESVYPRVAEELMKAAEVAAKESIRLVLEDEGSSNVGTGRELAKMLKLVPAKNFGANWDIGNPTFHGEVSFPDGYNALDLARIWHMHLKGVNCQAGLKNCHETFADEGTIDLVGQFRALAQANYHETMSLECEFKAPGMSRMETAKRSMEGLLKVLNSALA